MTIELNPEVLDLTALIRPGDTVMVGQGTAEPVVLSTALIAQRERIGPINVFLGPIYTDHWSAAQRDTFSFVSYGAIGNLVQLARAGALDVLPTHMSELPGLIDSGALRVDVVLVQLSQNEAGEFSFGLAHDYLAAAMRRARVVIAEVNAHAPWTFGGEAALRDLRIDVVVRSERPLLTLPAAPIGESERRIAAHAIAHIPDGAVLETGVGSIPDAILAALGGHRDLGIHSGMVSDGIVALMEAGVVNNARKAIDRGISVAGVLFGSERLYRFAHRNPALKLQPPGYTHNAAVLARLERFVGINSAIEVDLTGQVNGEMAGNVYAGAVGGQYDFVRAARHSPGGRSIIALRTTAKNDTISRIVPRFAASVVTTPRADADLVVTEFGVADLRGQTLRERVRRMVEIAHPAFREELEREGYALWRR